MKTIESINLIYRDPNVRGGRPCIVGTSLRVTDIVMQQKYGESAPEQIAARFEITLGQVYAALAYYHEHQSEIDADIRDWEDFDRKLEEDGLVRTEDSLLL
ncbi:MAG: DUF433 domain-containing protein [Chloroflexi bacterium]|nr:DUF433 domain-containing protein [Chloroflexota bacterium]